MAVSALDDLVLSKHQNSIILIASSAALGDIEKLQTFLAEGLDHGLTVNDAKEVLTQLYAYAGFPRSLNALAALMGLIAAREKLGIVDLPGHAPSLKPPQGAELLKAGTRNQTKLAGAPVTGPLFDFAPAIDEYLKTHLFGDIFERDNFSWQNRELATVAMLSVLPGAEAQLAAHIRISMNTGISAGQLQQLHQSLTGRLSAEAGKRVKDALDKHLVAVLGD